MAFRRPPRKASSRAMPARHWAPRLTLLLILAFGATVMVVGRTNPALVGSIRSTITDGLVPVLTIAAKPAEALHNARTWLGDMATLKSENAALRMQVQTLSQWQGIANGLQAENDALRKLIRVIPSGSASYVAARIIAESGGPYMHTALIDGGTSQGIAVDQAVIGVDGLIGRVVEASGKSSRVLLLTDINSRVPVIGEISRERSIIAGNNSPELGLDYLEAGSKLQVGERLLTSGDGGVFPPGIPVGVVSSTGSSVTAHPLANWTRTEYVSVVAYQF